MKKTLLPTLLVCGSLAMAETAVAQSRILAQWPLTANNSDNAAVRAPGITTQTPRFRTFVLSDGLPPAAIPPGTAPTAYPAYSAVGQAFGVRSDGGGWSSNNTPPGPGSIVKRVNYENFAITAATANRADTLIFTAGVPASANGKAAVSYSLSNFTTDSASITDTYTAAGALPPAANGSFGVNPTTSSPGPQSYNALALPQYGATSPQVTFRMALNGATGVAIAAGRTLSVRLHFACSSGSNGRYILLKDVTIKARTGLATRTGVATTLQAYPNPAQNQVVVPHAALGQDARITVYNAVGAPVASAVAKAGSSQTAVSLQSLAAGLYLVEYANGTERSSARMVKE